MDDSNNLSTVQNAMTSNNTSSSSGTNIVGSSSSNPSQNSPSTSGLAIAPVSAAAAPPQAPPPVGNQTLNSSNISTSTSGGDSSSTSFSSVGSSAPQLQPSAASSPVVIGLVLGEGSGSPSSLNLSTSPCCTTTANLATPSPSSVLRSSSATSNITINSGGTDKSDDNLDSCSKSSDSCNLVAVGEATSQLTGASSQKSSSAKSQKNLAERAKKTPWYNAIYPSYKARTEEFKKLFREVAAATGDDERLIVDYSCAIQKDILVHGRLYVSQNYLCFHANIIVWETRLSIRWKDVTSITKEKTARVIPNAILVCTENEKHFLTSFTSRDKTYLMLFRVWQNALMDKPINPQELWQWVHTCYGDQLGLTSDDEDYIDPYEKDNRGEDGSINSSIFKQQSSEDIPNSKEHNNNTSQSDEPTGPSIILGGEEGTMVFAATKETGTKSSKKSALAKAAFVGAEGSLSTTGELLPTDMSDSTESEPEEEFFAGVECNSLHSGRQLVHTILPINVDILFELLFSKSKFLTEFHNTRKTTDMIHGEWKLNKDGLKERVVSLTIAITQTIGPRSAQVTETQLMRDCSKPGQLYSIDVNAVQGGIPYADSFYVTQHYCMSRTKDDHTVLSVHAQIHYKKNIFGFVRGFIEKNTWVGLEDFYNALLRNLQSEYCIPPAKAKSRRSRKSNASQHAKVLEEPIPRSSIPYIHPTVAPVNSPKPNTYSHTFFSWFVVILLIILLSINVALYLKLHTLEGENENLFRDSAAAKAAFNQKILQNPPQTHADWLALLHQQETKHAQEMIKWQQILGTVTDLLRKVSSICENIPKNVTYYDDTQPHATVSKTDEL
ncbi:protein Aster-B-like [Uranotaenia lowii]|uniref:protein Aster-B-like n=1 Tax=Uranotaenia lowii TaxID=190385 RepID=UPI00247833DD|nr:protein Aster-B-like [Uranotaenia lowii]